MNLDKTDEAIEDVKHALDLLAKHEEAKLDPVHKIVHLKVNKVNNKVFKHALDLLAKHEEPKLEPVHNIVHLKVNKVCLI